MRAIFIDGFAGGGGTSTGIAQAIGRDVDIAIGNSVCPQVARALVAANQPELIEQERRMAA